jgi:phosphate transport system protein
MRHTVRSYDKDLQKIQDNIEDMADLVIEMLNIVALSISGGESNLDQQVELAYKKINKLDIEIEEGAIAMLALRQPMAIDLRHCVAGLKLAVILERAGDLTKNIFDKILLNESVYDAEILKLVNNMTFLNIERISKCMLAYREADLKIAREVCDQDAEIDNWYAESINLIAKLLPDTKEYPEDMIKLIFVLKNMERVGDYISKVALLVQFIYSGQRVAG